jgi:predicted permease
MNWLRRLLQERRLDKQLDAELHFHFDAQVLENLRSGMTEQQARRAARLAFGEMQRVKEHCRESRGTMWIHSTWHDLLVALRRLRHDKLFAFVVSLTLALGIAANIVVFSAVEHVLLRALPYPHADKIFAIRALSPAHGDEPMQVSAADFYDWSSQSRAFVSMAAFGAWRMNLTNVEDPRPLKTELVSANLFSTLGVSPALGRTFLPEEDREKAPFVVVISHRLWRSLGQPASVIGSRLTLNGSSATVIGVMPDSFAFPSRDIDVWTPPSLSARDRSNREGRWLQVIGRLAPGATRNDAASEMDVIASRLASAYPAADAGWRISILPLQDEIVGRARPILLTMQAAVVFLLLIACANLANLLLARAASRTREIATRAALGASRFRILRQLLVESLVLVSLGGAAGCFLAIQGVKLTRIYGEPFLPRAAEIHLSLPVMLVAVCAFIFTAVLFGLAPARHLSRADLGTHIGSQARSIARGYEKEKGVLISVEMALAAVLLVAAGLLDESLMRLLSTPTGYQTDHLLTLQLTLSKVRYPTSAAQQAFFNQVLTRVRNLPGVIAAGEISDTPMEGNSPTFEIALPGMSAHPADQPMQAGMRVISPGFFSTAGIALLQGRDINDDDRADTMPVALVNESMAHRFWPGAPSLGRQFRLKDEQRWLTVIGVVPDVKHMGVRENEGAGSLRPVLPENAGLAGVDHARRPHLNRSAQFGCRPPPRHPRPRSESAAGRSGNP